MTLSRRGFLGAAVAGVAARGFSQPARPVDVSALSLEEKVGQLFLLAFEGDSASQAETMLGRYFVGSVYLSQDNLRGVEQSVELLNALQRLGAGTSHALPIFAACDQEGAWSVLNPHATAGPGNLALGATSPAQVEQMYAVFGRELRVLGIAANLAPVSDVNANPRNPIIGTRSFGQDPQRVAAAVAAAVRGLHAGGTRACAKHFPGHGDTSQDSHRGLATVTRTRQQIVNGDLLPFRAAVRAGVDLVMTAHLVYPAFDREWPATLSPAILQGVLRKELGFRGVILTDSFSMGAIKRSYGTAAAAIRAINAGADLIMLAEERYGDEPSNYLKEQVAVLEAVRAAAKDGGIPRQRLDEAVGRVLKLKTDAGLFASPQRSAADALSVVGCAAHRAVELECARKAVTVPRNRDRRIPLAVRPDSRVLLISPVRSDAYASLKRMRGIGPNIHQPPTAVLHQEILRRCPSGQLLNLSEPGDVANHRERLRAANVVIVATENYPLPGFDFPTENQARVVAALLAAGIDPVVVGLRDPYELLGLPSVRTYIAALGYAPVCAQAAVEVLFGERRPSGRLPVEAR